MKLLFELSKEHDTLPEAEVLALYEAYGVKFNSSKHKNLLLVEGALEPQILQKRLAFTHSVYRVFAEGPDVKAVLNKAKIDGSFAVRANGFKENQKTEREGGAFLRQETGKDIDLRNPDICIYLFKLENVIGCDQKYEIDKKGFKERDPQNRPYFHPTALKPKLARAMVNLARVGEGDTILDPFCGTGSILIEAALVGAKPVGIDLDKSKIDGCKRTSISLN